MSTTGNVLRMQQEAAQRVQRMQEHSRRLVREHPINVYHGVTFEPSPPCEEEAPVEPPCDMEKTPPPCKKETTGGGIAALLGGDQEQTLVLLLAVILAKNGAPLELVLALLYIAM